MHATEFLSAKSPTLPTSVLVMFGSERYFRQEILHRIPGASGDDAELNLTRLVGDKAEIRDVMAELKTVSMFGDQRIVMIEDADEFVDILAQRVIISTICSSGGYNVKLEFTIGTEHIDEVII